MGCARHMESNRRSRLMTDGVRQEVENFLLARSSPPPWMQAQAQDPLSSPVRYITIADRLALLFKDVCPCSPDGDPDHIQPLWIIGKQQICHLRGAGRHF